MVAQYRSSQASGHHNLIRDMDLQDFEKKVAKLILEETNTPETDCLNALTDSAAAPSENDGINGRERRNAIIAAYAKSLGRKCT